MINEKMIKEKMKSLKNKLILKKVIRTEILFTPMLIVVPLIIGFFLIYDWYLRGFLEGNFDYTAELFFGIIIIIGNIAFDIPFIKSLITLSKKSNK
jgi:hypothetical protein